jgi:hypothetical protein
MHRNNGKGTRLAPFCFPAVLLGQIPHSAFGQSDVYSRGGNCQIASSGWWAGCKSIIVTPP